MSELPQLPPVDLDDTEVEHMRAYGRACYEAALEAAAVVCEDKHFAAVSPTDASYNLAIHHGAAAIRALKEKT